MKNKLKIFLNSIDTDSKKLADMATSIIYKTQLKISISTESEGYWSFIGEIEELYMLLYYMTCGCDEHETVDIC